MQKYKNVVLSDISEMFLKVILDPADRRHHRFHFNGEEYEWLVILFRNLSLPSRSQRVIQLNCNLNGEGLDEALESIYNACYMDDLADSQPDEETALEFAQQLIILFDHCSMTVQKFYLNSPLVCKSLDQNLLAKSIQFDKVTLDLVYNIGRVLGMSYSVPDDCLTYAGKFKKVKEWIKGKVDINLDNEPKQDGWTKKAHSSFGFSVRSSWTHLTISCQIKSHHSGSLEAENSRSNLSTLAKLVGLTHQNPEHQSCSLDRPQSQRNVVSAPNLLRRF
jgi:hypothetical protein